MPVNFNFQKMVLKRLGEKLARESDVDPVRAAEALDVLDSTLDYGENKKLYFEELRRRGVSVPTEVPREEEEEERAMDWVMEQMPAHLRPYVEGWTEEIKSLREKIRAAPPPRAPRAPRVPRVPAVEPKPIEAIAVSPLTGKPLTRVVIFYHSYPETVTEPVPWREMTEAERVMYERNGVSPMRTRTVEGKEAYDVTPLLLFQDPEDGRYYQVVDFKLLPRSHVDVLTQVRKMLRPLAPTPRRAPTRLERIYDESLAVERLPEFKQYVEREVGMPWSEYAKLDGWSKDAVRREFSAKGLRGLR